MEIIMKYILPSAVVCLLLVPCLHAEETATFIELGDPAGERVAFVAFSPDGKKIITTNTQYIAKIWDIETGKELQKFDDTINRETENLTTYYGHNVKLSAADFSPDGKRVATISWERFARVWDVESGKELHKLKGHNSEVRSIAFSPDGKNIVTAARDGTARIWDADSGRELRKFSHPVGTVSPGTLFPPASAAFSPDGKKIVTFIHDASGPNSIRVWDTHTGEMLLELKADISINASPVFSPDGKKIVAVVDNRNGGNVKIWDAGSGKELHELGPHNGIDRRVVSLSADGKKLVTVSSGTPQIWDVDTGKKLPVKLQELSHGVFFSLSPDGKKVIALPPDSSTTIRIWDADTGKNLHTLDGHHWNLFRPVFSPDGKRVVVTDGDTHHGVVIYTRIWVLD